MKNMKCLILAAGYATRLYPLTENFPKPLLKVGDKAILDWLIEDLEKTGLIDEYIVVTNHKFAHIFENWANERVTVNGYRLTVKDSDFSHQTSAINNRTAITVIDDGTSTNETRLGAVKDIELGILTRKVEDDLLVMAGDNLLDFSLGGFISYAREKGTSCIMRYHEPNTERLHKCGVVEIDSTDRILSMEEKPAQPKSNYAVVGLYFYPNKVVDVARNIKPSARGEYEITTVNQQFLTDGELKVQTLGRGFAWLDTGTFDSLSEASTYIEVLEKRQGLKVGCLEGIAYRKGWIDEERMRKLAQPMLKNQYGQYLLKVIDDVKRFGACGEEF